MSDLEFNVAKRRTQPITFTLGGDAMIHPADEDRGVEAVYGRDNHEYSFTPPKSAVMLMPILDHSDDASELAVTRSTFDWLGKGLSESDNDRIIARLRDEKDDLDSDTLNEVIQKLSEMVSGRPTT